ncbi:hypothetical protein [Glaesserella sp.]|uniref:hypothetical protein n=1 Tax=Glaesserella sp. TaxID=2094731 RepID=UPI0035A13D98
MKKYLFSLLALTCVGSYAQTDAAPVKSIDIYVAPYYSAANGVPEYVQVYTKIDALLMKNTRESFQQAVNIVEADPAFVTPMTMYALAARAYDLGLRDEAVFWYYVGQSRLSMVDHVLDLSKMSMAEYAGFDRLVGAVVNPYAFCRIEKQRELQLKAVNWVKSHPYQALFEASIPSKQQDRQKALADAINNLDKSLADTKAYFDVAKNRAEFELQRQENKVDQRFCW